MKDSWLRLQYVVQDYWSGEACEIDDKIFLATSRPPTVERRSSAAKMARQAALAWEPDDARTRYDLAVALEASGDVAGAARELARARRLDATLPAAVR